MGAICIPGSWGKNTRTFITFNILVSSLLIGYVNGRERDAVCCGVT